MKKIQILLFLFFCTLSQSQTFIKVNAFTTLLTIPNVGIETSIGKKSTFQFDVTASFWKSIKVIQDNFICSFQNTAIILKKKIMAFMWVHILELHFLIFKNGII